MMTKTIGICALFAALLICSEPASSQHATEILRRSSEVYARLRTYSFTGTSRMKVDADGMQFETAEQLDMAQGDTVNETLALQYSSFRWEKPAAGSQVPYPSISVQFPFDFARFAQNVRLARIIRKEPIVANGKKMSCYVVEVHHMPTKHAGLRWYVAETPVVLWIDEATLLVLRVSFSMVQVATSSEPERNIAWMIDFTSFKLNGDPEDWLVKRARLKAEQVANLRATVIGSDAPDFKLKDLEGRDVVRSELQNKVVLLDFWATWCGPCRAELPIIAKIEREWTTKGLVVLPITDESAKYVRAFQKHYGRQFRTLVDGESAFRAYGVFERPTVALIDRNGKIAVFEVATLSESELVEKLKLAGLK